MKFSFLVFCLTFFASQLQAQMTAPGNALDFAGDDDFVAIAAGTGIVPTSGDYTICLWARHNAAQTDSYFELFSQGNNLYFGGNTSGYIRVGDSWFTAIPFPAAGAWHHYAIVRSGSDGYLYIDGILRETKIGGLLSPTAATFYFGKQYDPHPEFFNGIIDEFNVWNRVLTVNEIRTRMSVELAGTETNLVAYYNFDQGTAGGDNTAITSLSAKTGGNNGAFSGFTKTGSGSNFVTSGAMTPYATLVYPGNTLHFDGVNDYVSINNAANLNPGSQNLTVECWFNATTTATNEHHLYNKENLYEASIIDGYFRFALMPNWVWQGGTSFPVTPGQWYHIAVVYDHVNITIYKNGQLFSTLAKTDNVGTNTAKLLIGARGDMSPTAFFNGKIDEFRVWSTARTACEINSNMANSLTGSEAGLVAYYDFDSGTPGGTNTGLTTLSDIAGGDNTGTLTNMALSGSASNWLASQAGQGLPMVTTTGSANVLANTTDVNGSITSTGSGNATIRGVCYNTTGCPTVNNPKIQTSGDYGTGAFTIGLTGLSATTTYYARAYAINSSGTSYGSQISFTTLNVPAPPSGITGTTPICPGSPTQLTATGAVGTVYWYTAGCGGTQVFTGNPYTPSPTVDTNYYARNYNNGAFSATCASVTITVNPASVGGVVKW